MRPSKLFPCCTRRRKEVSVELVAPTHFKALLTEPPIEGRPHLDANQG